MEPTSHKLGKHYSSERNAIITWPSTSNQVQKPRSPQSIASESLKPATHLVLQQYQWWASHRQGKAGRLDLRVSPTSKDMPLAWLPGDKHNTWIFQADNKPFLISNAHYTYFQITLERQ